MTTDQELDLNSKQETKFRMARLERVRFFADQILDQDICTEGGHSALRLLKSALADCDWPKKIGPKDEHLLHQTDEWTAESILEREG